MEIVISKFKLDKKLDARVDIKNGFIWTERGLRLHKT